MRADGDGFGDFVVAWWERLEAVALVATLDPARARAVTADALGAVGRRWAGLVEDGRPGAAARRELLSRLVARSGADRATPSMALPPVLSDVADGDPVDEALLGALATLDAPVRALLGAELVWEVEAAEVLPEAEGLRAADRMRLGSAVVQARDVLRGAHRAALAGAGRSSDDDRLEADLADLVGRLAASTGPPPHPEDLVPAASGRVRRRLVAAGGGAAATVAALAWWGVTSAAGPSRPAAPSGTPTTAGPDAAAWATTRTWSPRGALARDVTVQAFVARTGRPGARLLFAEDIEGRRLVVSTWVETGGAQGTNLQAWTGPAGSAGEGLDEVELAFGGVYEVDDVAAVGVPHPRGAVLLFASRPTVALAQYSLHARPTRAGLISRVWRDVPLEDGVGWTLLDTVGGPALRARCRGYDGPLPGPMVWAFGTAGFSGPQVRAEVAAVTGIPAERLTVEVVRGPVPPGARVQGTSADLELRLVTVTTPDGGVVRIPVFGEPGDDSTFVTAQESVVVPAADVRTPVLVRVDDRSSSQARFMVLSPAGGATVQLASPDGTVLAPPVPLRERTALVTVAEQGLLGGFRAVVRDASGRPVSDAPVLSGRSLYDLLPSNESGTPA